MAVEVAQYLQNKFLTSLVEAESELSGSVNLLSYFEAIKDILEERDVISSSAVEPSPLIYHLSQLNYALVECRNVANKCKELDKKLLLFNKPFKVYFILSMKRRLTTLKENFRKYYIHVRTRWLEAASERARERTRERVRKRMREWLAEREREWEWEWDREWTMMEEEGEGEGEMEGEMEGVTAKQWARTRATARARERERERHLGRARARARASERGREREWEWEWWKRTRTRTRAKEMGMEMEEWERQKGWVFGWEREWEREWERQWERQWARQWVKERQWEWQREEFRVHVFGFDEKAKKIEGMLFGSETGIGFSAIGIVGIAGAGKTTLVRKALNIKRVRNEFSPIILLCMSDMIKEEEEFTRVVSFRIVTSILKQLGDNANDDTDQEEGIRLEKRLKRLYELLRGKKYLIVLDDVWHMNDFYSDLAGGVEDDNTGDRLSHGLPKDSGGAIMVTSRITQVARGMVGDQNNLILVEQLDRDTCWRIFMDSIKNQDLKDSTGETLEKIKNEIKDQSLGLPLAAKTLAKFIPERIREIQEEEEEERERERWWEERGRGPYGPLWLERPDRERARLGLLEIESDC